MKTEKLCDREILIQDLAVAVIGSVNSKSSDFYVFVCHYHPRPPFHL